tara:strand:+ start:1646 stop:3124 length:1479 start_codon:yes stop_codon:yes gene_type:complete
MKKNNKNYATVIVTDIVGYSKLTGKNQELALELLAEHDKIILESIADYNGNILVNRGDGFVVMFNKPINAVLCSMDIQNKIKIRNKFNTKNRIFRIRIGAHFGNYVKEGNEYHGDCIDVSSMLEPLAPYGGILISENLNSLLALQSNIYTREYGKVKINSKNEISYEVYLNLLDWYANKRKKMIHSIDENKYLKLSHNLYRVGDYSGSIKFANSIYEKTKNSQLEFNILSFLCNGFISLGQLDVSKSLFRKIKSNKYKKIDDELRSHLLKLEAHLHFNNEEWSKADLLYNESFNILKTIDSKYKNEVLFYIYLNMIFSNYLDDKKIKMNKKLINDDYKVLIDCLLLLINNKKISQILINKVNKIKKQQLKSYSYWILSKYYGENNMINESYDNETKAQDILQNCSKKLSDKLLRETFLKNLVLHAKILSETSVQIDDLVEISDVQGTNDSEQTIVYNSSTIFKFCINCGEENISKKITCSYCNTNLSESFYN